MLKSNAPAFSFSSNLSLLRVEVCGWLGPGRSFAESELASSLGLLLSTLSLSLLLGDVLLGAVDSKDEASSAIPGNIDRNLSFQKCSNCIMKCT